jgi:hypothetical protein
MPTGKEASSKPYSRILREQVVAAVIRHLVSAVIIAAMIGAAPIRAEPSKSEQVKTWTVAQWRTARAAFVKGKRSGPPAVAKTRRNT